MGAHLQRCVDQLVEAAGQPPPPLVLGEGDKGSPLRWQPQLQEVRTPAFRFDAKGDPGQGEESMVTIQVGGAHRELGGHDPVADLHRLQAGEPQAPSLGSGAQKLQAFSALPGFQPLQLPHVITDQVGPGGPGGQPQPGTEARGGEGEPGIHQMPLGLGEIQPKEGWGSR
jgi:hypothetical protein